MSIETSATTLVIRQLGRRNYEAVWRAMQEFTDSRSANTRDEIWLVEHEPVFTQGQAGKEEHLLFPGDIPVIKVDRGGQVTYHGPGQLVAYVMLDIRRLKIGVRQLVSHLENSIVELLKSYQINAYPKADAPGVYVDGKKIASLGLRIRKGCSFHGLALNINMDLTPFQRINPCGYAGLEMIQAGTIGGPNDVATAQKQLIDILAHQLSYPAVEHITGFTHDND